MNVKEVYECPRCEKEHDDDHDARWCCDLRKVYRCGKCNKYHWSDYELASECCNASEKEKLKVQIDIFGAKT